MGISNMPIKEISAVVDTKEKEVMHFQEDEGQGEDEEGKNEPKIKIQFEKTPLMSTYLVGIAIGEFDFVEELVELNCYPDSINESQKKTVPIRVYTPLNRRE